MSEQIKPITDQNLDQATAFLDRHVETSLFLASNLSKYGSELGDSMNSGNFKCIEADGHIAGVFCLARRGILLAETGGRTEFSSRILESCLPEDLSIQGVIGEWRLAESIWNCLLANPEVRETNRSKETLYRLSLSSSLAGQPDDNQARQLTPSDFAAWRPLNILYMREEGFPDELTPEQQITLFEESTEAGRWWGYFDGNDLVSIAALNACYKHIGQVGGVFTKPAARRKGLSKTIMRKLMSDSAQLHNLTKLILFTAENNVAAKKVYESLGFEACGKFAIFFAENTYKGATNDG